MPIALMIYIFSIPSNRDGSNAIISQILSNNQKPEQGTQRLLLIAGYSLSEAVMAKITSKMFIYLILTLSQSLTL
jgi:hypothetical protein